MDIESRMLAAINEFRLAERGTLWIIKDTAWEKAISDFERKRAGHPGLSISTKTFKSLVDTVPMMIGSNKYTGGSFVVQDVMPNANIAAAAIIRMLFFIVFVCFLILFVIV